MAYNEQLARRVEKAFERHGTRYQTKKMMGGLCFMVDDKMCVGVDRDRLMARLDPEIYEAMLKRKGCAPMDFTGRALKGFVFVAPEGIANARALDFWIQKALEFNPKAKRSKQRKKSTK